MVITANELKVKGITAFAKKIKKYESVFISVRGKPEYVLMTKQEYSRLYEEETLRAWENSKRNIENGDFHTSLEMHLNEVNPC